MQVYDVDEWLAVSFMCQKPVRPTYTRLARLPSEDRGALLGVTPFRRGPECGQRVMWLTIWEAVQVLRGGGPLSAHLQCQWYQFAANSSRQVIAIKPWRQRVRAMDIQPLILWRGDDAELVALRASDAKKAQRARRVVANKAKAKGASLLAVCDREAAAAEGCVPMAALENGIVQVEGGESDDGDLEYEFDDARHADDDAMASASDAEERSATSSFFGEWDIGDADLDEALLADAPAQVASVVDGAEVVGHALELAPDDSAVVESAPLLLPAAPVARDGFDRRGEVVCLTLPEGRLKFYHKSNIFVAECTIEEHQRELSAAGRPMKCHLTKGAFASRCAGRRGQGRPLGLLMSW